MDRRMSKTVLKKMLKGKTFQQAGEELGFSRAYAHAVLTPEDRVVWQEYRQENGIKQRGIRKKAIETELSRRWYNKPVDRFWENVNRRGDDECWEWQSTRTNEGYGYVRWGEKTTSAHRVAWEIANDKSVPQGLIVCHHCDNPSCCNPKHLFAGTYKDNTQDAIAKGRRKRKFSKDQVIKIRERHSSGETQVSIARDFGVHSETIGSITRRKTYKDV